MFVGSAYSRHFHLYKDTAGSWLWQRILAHFVSSGFDQSGCENLLRGHRHDLPRKLEMKL
jgi:hypothetical protein